MNTPAEKTSIAVHQHMLFCMLMPCTVWECAQQASFCWWTAWVY